MRRSEISELDYISYLQRKIIISSILYYELDMPKITDAEYDIISKELVKLQKTCKDLPKSDYYYVMKDFDGSTGFYLFDRLTDKDKTYLLHLAHLFGWVHTKVSVPKVKPKRHGKLF